MNNKMNNNECVNHVVVVNGVTVDLTVTANRIAEEQPVSQPTQSPRFTNKTAQQRKDALAKAGIDVSKYFAMGADMLVRMNANGEPEQVLDDDPIFNKISSQGYINVHKLFRRWVMAQMFELMESEYTYYSRYNFTQRIRNKGYEYSWEMLEKELYAQMKMRAHGDDANFNARNLDFNRNLAFHMAQDYMKKLEEYINSLRQKNCNKYKYHQKYVTVRGTDIFVEDLEAKVYRNLRGALKKIGEAWMSIDKLYYAVKEFNEYRTKLDWGTPQCEEWLQAYKNSGAFWTAQNLIMFHGCYVYTDNGTRLNRKASMDVLNSLHAQYSRSHEGWRMVGFLRKLMNDNNIDITKKRAEWREAKKNR